MTKGVTLKQIRYFHALAQHCHFSKAAEACAISQPALSLQIRELEAQLGRALVERAQGQTLLTAFGKLFLQRSGDILQDIDDLCALALADHQEPTGPIRLGVIPTLGRYILPTFLSECSLRYPALRPQLREATTAELLERLHEGQIDAALLALPVPLQGLCQMPLFYEAFILARPTADRHRPAPAPEALHEEQLLLLEEGHCLRDQTLSFCKIDGNRQRDRLLTGNSLSTLVQLVGSGIGVTLLPELAVPLESRAATISLCAFAPPQPARHIGMVWRKSSAIAPHLEKLGTLAKEIGLDLRADCQKVLDQQPNRPPVQEMNNRHGSPQKFLSAWSSDHMILL